MQDSKGTNSNRVPDAQFLHRLLTTVGLIVAVVLLILLLWFSIDVWLTVFAGILLAIFLSTLTGWLQRITHLPHGLALAAIILLLLGIMLLGGWLLAPKAAEQFGELQERLPKALTHLQQRLEHSPLHGYLPKSFPPLSSMSSGFGKIATSAAGLFSVSLQAVARLFVIIFLGIYLAASPQLYVRGIVALFPVAKRPRVCQVLDRLSTTLGHWLLGQLTSMVVVGTLIGVGLGILGIPLALALGVLAGLLNFVPIVGSLLSAIPAVLLGFVVGPWHPLYVIIVYVIVNSVIESHLLVPLIQKYAVDLPPAIAVLALLLLGELFGFMGLLLAIPLAATFMVLVKMIYLKDVLGDHAAPSAGVEAADEPQREAA